MQFKDIYTEYFVSVYRYLLSLTEDESAAEELAQETFYKAFVNIDSFKGESGIYTWLCSIGKNAWFKELRRRKKFQPYSEAVTDNVCETAENIVIRRERLRIITEILSELESPYSDVFIMHTYGEKKLSEIAGIFGKSESWARVTLYRAKAKIAEKMEERGYEI